MTTPSLPWQVVFAALTVLAAAMYVLNDRKSKKQ